MEEWAGPEVASAVGLRVVFAFYVWIDYGS